MTMNQAVSPLAGTPAVSAELARFAATSRWEDVPQAVRHEAGAAC